MCGLACRDSLKWEISKLEAAAQAAAGMHAAMDKELAQCKEDLAAMQQDLAEWPNAW